MRYGDISCEAYCENCANDDTDPIIELARTKAGIADKIAELRSQRWGFCSLTFDENNKDAKIIITNRIAFEINLESEGELLDDLTKYVRIFNDLNDLFSVIETKFPRLPSPNLNGLGHLKADCLLHIDRYKSRVKNILNEKLGIQSKGKDANEIMNDPEFLEQKSEYESYIKIEEGHLVELNNYIGQIHKILGGE